MIDIIQIEGVTNCVLESIVGNPIIYATRLKESMVYIYYRLHQSVDWSLDYEVEAEGLCSLKWKEMHDKME